MKTDGVTVYTLCAIIVQSNLLIGQSVMNPRILRIINLD